MPKTRLVVELGMGVDLHGQDYTKAARKAVEDAIHRGSLLYLADAFQQGSRPKVYIDVAVTSPKPEAVDGDAVLQAVPFGEKSIDRREYTISEIAARAATVPEAVSRTVGFFRERGWVASSRTKITILEVEELAESAQLDINFVMPG